MTDAQIIGLASFAVAFAIFLVCLNVWHRDSRAHLTQAECDEEDETAERW
jgi:hypothetical protein